MNEEMTETIGTLPDISEMKLDLTKDEKLRSASLLMAIRYHVDTIIKDPRYLELMIAKEKESKFSNDPDADQWHLRPSTVHAVVYVAKEFEQYLLGNRPGQVLLVGNEVIPPLKTVAARKGIPRPMSNDAMTAANLDPARSGELRRKPRIIGPASELERSERYCTCCKKPLGSKIAWLELDQRSNTYHDFGGVPSDQSQGWFPFGLTCAANLLNAEPAS